MVCGLLFAVYATDAISQSVAAAAEQGTISGVGGPGIFFILCDAGVPWGFFFQAPMLQFVMMYCIGGYLQLHGFKQTKFQKAGFWVLLTAVLVGLTDMAVVRQWLKGYGMISGGL